MPRFTYVIVFALCWSLCSSTARADDHLRGTWYFSWGGIPFAKLWIDQITTEQRYTLTASFKSKGIVRLFSSLKTLTVSEGIFRADGASQTLTLNYQNNTKHKHAILTFDESGALISRDVVPEDDPTYRPRVAKEALKGVTTPGNALLSLQQQSCAAKAQGKTRYDVTFYEGKRLMHIHAALGSQKATTIDDVSVPVLPLTLARSPVNGFTPKELKRMEKGEPAATLYLRSQDCFPLALEVPVGIGTLTAYWQAE